MAGRGAGLMLFWRPSVDGEGEEGVEKGKLRSLAGADAAAQDGSGSLQRASVRLWWALVGGYAGRRARSRKRHSSSTVTRRSPLFVLSSLPLVHHSPRPIPRYTP